MRSSGIFAAQFNRYPISPAANPCCNTSLKIGVVLSLGWAMRRRSRASIQSAKAQRRKGAKPKRSNAPKALRNPGVSIAGQETVVARLTRERDEALEQQTATS